MDARKLEPGIHALLPWYVRGTLSESESAAFREHLPTCEECRAEMEVIGKIRDLIDRHGPAFLEEHPPAERLVAAVRGELADRDEKDRIRRHLELCAACAIEARWIAGDEVAGRQEQPMLPAARPASSWGAWLALAGAAAAVGIVVLVGPWRGTESPGVRVTRPTYVRPAARGAAGENVFTLRPGESHVDLAFEIDFPPASFPVRLEILDAAGKEIHAEDRIEREGLVDGTLLLVDCHRRICAPGTYLVRVVPSAGEEPPLESRVRIVQE